MDSYLYAVDRHVLVDNLLDDAVDVNRNLLHDDALDRQRHLHRCALRHVKWYLM